MIIDIEELLHVAPVLGEVRQKTLLHVGCGSAPKARLPKCFRRSDWTEVRVDIDASVLPDIVADIKDLSAVASGSVDAIWSSHNLEHVDGYQVQTCLSEFRRVLTCGGFALITLPDLDAIARFVMQGKLMDVVYESPAGGIRPLDMLFGHQRSLKNGSSFMAHRTGFTAGSLTQALIDAKFDDVRTRKGRAFDIWTVAIKRQS